MDPENPSAFNKLFKRNVPHILEMIFFSLDFKSYKNCQKVCQDWRGLFSFEPFENKAESVYFYEIGLPKIQAEYKSTTNSKLRKSNESGLIASSKSGDYNEVHSLLLIGVDPNCKARSHGNTPLHWAVVKNGNEDVVEILLKAGAEPNMTNIKRETPLHLSSGGGFNIFPPPRVTKLLLDAGGDPNIPDAKGQTSLHRATNDIANVLLLLKAGADLNKADYMGETPLLRAVGLGRHDIAQALIDAKADIHIVDAKGACASSIAAKKGDVETIKLLLKAGVDPNKVIFDAVYFSNNHNVVKVLLDAGAGPNMVNQKGESLLSWSARRGFTDLIRLFLIAGANPNLSDHSGISPLHWAAKSGLTTAIKELLAARADVNKADNKGISPLYLAVDSGSADAVKLLLKSGASHNHQDKEGMSPLTFACQMATINIDVVNILLKSGSDPNLLDVNGRVPLHWAASRRHKDLVKLLLKGGANPNILDIKKESPLNMATTFSKDIVGVVKLLLKSGAHANTSNRCGITPLHRAAGQCNRDLVQLLLRQGADPNAQNGSGETPLFWAARQGQGHPDMVPVVQLLLEAGADSNKKTLKGQTAYDIAAEFSANLAALQALGDMLRRYNFAY